MIEERDPVHPWVDAYFANEPERRPWLHIVGECMLRLVLLVVVLTVHVLVVMPLGYALAALFGYTFAHAFFGLLDGVLFVLGAR